MNLVSKKLMILVYSLVLLSTLVSYSQETNSFYSKSQSLPLNKTKGFLAGATYSNLTNFFMYAEFESKNTNNKYTDTYKGGDHVGLAGVQFGYFDKYAFGAIGLDGIASIQKSINKSEIKEMTIYKVQGDLIVPLNDMFSLIGGLNISKTYLKNEINSDEYDVSGGLQAGVSAQVDNLQFQLGTQIIGMRKSISDNNGSGKVTGTIDGVIAQMNYLL